MIESADNEFISQEAPKPEPGKRYNFVNIIVSGEVFKTQKVQSFKFRSF